MQIGVDLGWSGVRAVTVTAEGEILSVPDAQDPEILETTPVVACVEGGALVGRNALVLSDSSILRLTGGSPKQAFAEAARGSVLPLSILLTKLARDIADYGAQLEDTLFCVDPDVLAIINGTANSNAFEAAAAAAGFRSVRYVRRSEAVALYVAWRGDKGRLDSDTPNEPPPCKLILDAGFRSLRLSRVLFTDFQEAAAPDWLPAEDDLLTSSFGHFTRIVANVLPGQKWRDPFTLDAIWTLVKNPNGPHAAVILDADRRPQVFDVSACRDQIAKDILAHLEAALDIANREWKDPSLAMIKAGGIEGLVVLAGEYASLPEVRTAVHSFLNAKLTPRSEFAKSPALPPNALAVAVALGVASDHSQQAKTEQETGEIENHLRMLPINDGHFWTNAEQSTSISETKTIDGVDGNQSTTAEAVDPITLLDQELISQRLNDFDTAHVGQLGKDLGSLWAVEIDRLLRRVATAPTVGLKAVYEKQLRDLGVSSDRLDPASIIAAFDVPGSDVNRLQASVASRNFSDFKVEEQFTNEFAAAFAEFGRAAGTPFATYATGERKQLVPEGTSLTLAYNAGGDYDARLPDRGLAVRDRLVVNASRYSAKGPAPSMAPEQALGVSSDGFRPLLAASFLKRDSVGMFRSFASDVAIFVGGRGPLPLLSWAALAAFVILVSAAGFPSVMLPVTQWITEALGRSDVKWATVTSESLQLPCAAPAVVAGVVPPRVTTVCTADTVPFAIKPPVFDSNATCYVAVLRLSAGIAKSFLPEPNKFLTRIQPADNTGNTANSLCSGGEIDPGLVIPALADKTYSVVIQSEPPPPAPAGQRLQHPPNTFSRNILINDKDNQPVVLIQELVWVGWNPSRLSDTATAQRLPFNRSGGTRYLMQVDLEAAPAAAGAPAPAAVNAAALAAAQPIFDSVLAGRSNCIDEYLSLAVVPINDSKQVKGVIQRELARPIAAGAPDPAMRYLLRRGPPSPPEPTKANPKKPLMKFSGGTRVSNAPALPSISAPTFVGECEMLPKSGS